MYLINLQGKDSIYEQIKSQITRFVEIGVLKPNDKLPSVRSLAQELGINPNTVARAYQELEADGIIYTLNKKGAFVADGAKADKEPLIKKAIEALKQEGIRKDELLKVIQDVYKEDSHVDD